MGATLKLTAIAYLLMGLGVNTLFNAYAAPNYQYGALGSQDLNRLSLTSLTIAQDPPTPPPPSDGTGQPQGETGDAGSRV